MSEPEQPVERPVPVEAGAPIAPAEAAELIANGAAVLVDVREATPFAEAHPAGARNIPIDELADRLAQLPAGTQVLTSCGGGTRGPKAAQLLCDLGVDARAVRGGLRGWTSAGLPLESE